MWADTSVCKKGKQDWQFTYNKTMRCILATIVAVEKQKV